MRKSTSSLLFLFGILAVSTPQLASSQPRNALSIGGLSAEQAEGQFGKPDDKTSNGAGGLETWHYADSEIILGSGKVMLWNDPSGELEKRRMLSRFQLKSPEPAAGPSEKGWVNDWTPPQKPDTDAVIEKLLEK